VSLAVYFPLRAYLQTEAARLAALKGNDFGAAYPTITPEVDLINPIGETSTSCQHRQSQLGNRTPETGSTSPMKVRHRKRAVRRFLPAGVKFFCDRQ